MSDNLWEIKLKILFMYRDMQLLLLKRRYQKRKILNMGDIWMEYCQVKVIYQNQMKMWHACFISTLAVELKKGTSELFLRKSEMFMWKGNNKLCFISKWREIIFEIPIRSGTAKRYILRDISRNIFDKGYLHCKLISSQNKSFEAPVVQNFCIFSHPMLYQICEHETGCIFELPFEP